jgi:hypothetical protein
MASLGFTVGAVNEMLKRSDYAEVYRTTMRSHLAAFRQVDSRSFASYFTNHVLSELSHSSKPACERGEIREKIRKWMYLSTMKFDLLLALPEFITLVEKRCEAASHIYEGLPLGPVDEDSLEAVAEDGRKRLSEANQAIGHLNSTKAGLLVTWISSSFLSLEYICRTICYCACYGLLSESLRSPSTIQHQQVYKVLRRLETSNKQSDSCSGCPLLHQCQFSILTPLIGLYEVFYHLRVIGDYKDLVMARPDVQALIRNDFVPLSLETLLLAEEFMEVLSSGYLRSPLSFRQRSVLVPGLVAKVAGLAP